MTDELHPEGTRARLATLELTEAELRREWKRMAEAFEDARAKAESYRKQAAAYLTDKVAVERERDEINDAWASELALCRNAAVRAEKAEAELATLRAEVAALKAGLEQGGDSFEERVSRQAETVAFIDEQRERIEALEAAGRNMAVCLDRYRSEHGEESNDAGNEHPCVCLCARCQKAEHYSSQFRALLAAPAKEEGKP